MPLTFARVHGKGLEVKCATWIWLSSSWFPKPRDEWNTHSRNEAF